jgi:hypothetical protein
VAKNSNQWKKGRGKLGFLSPLIGSWKAEASSPLGPVSCTRSFEETLGGKYIQLNAEWNFSKGVYKEHALIGLNLKGEVAFWSFTSDGKNSTGILTDVTDVHPEAVGFEAQMPAGIARMIYWPDEEDGFYWAVESKNKKGWSRFAMHNYKPVK